MYLFMGESVVPALIDISTLILTSQRRGDQYLYIKTLEYLNYLP